MDFEQLVKELRFSCEDERYGGKYLYLSLINRSADAIEQLEKDVARAKEWASFWEKEANEALKKFQVAVASKPHWIPVTEEPPLKVGDVGYNGYLVFANGYYEVADYTTDKFDNVPYFHVNGEYEPDVTHYMLLPTPPKEE